MDNDNRQIAHTGDAFDSFEMPGSMDWTALAVALAVAFFVSAAA